MLAIAIVPLSIVATVFSKMGEASRQARQDALMVGSWHYEVTNSPDFGVIEFNSDGTVRSEGPAPNGIRASGTWNVENGKMFMKTHTDAGKIFDNAVYEVLMVTEKAMELQPMAMSLTKQPVWHLYRIDPKSQKNEMPKPVMSVVAQPTPAAAGSQSSVAASASSLPSKTLSEKFFYGDWSWSFSNEIQPHGNAVTTFKDDGTFTFTRNDNHSAKGTWRIDKNIMYWNYIMHNQYTQKSFQQRFTITSTDESHVHLQSIDDVKDSWDYTRLAAAKPETPAGTPARVPDARATALIPGSWHFTVTNSKDLGIAEFKSDGTFNFAAPAGGKAAGPWSIQDGKMSITEVSSAGKVENNTYEIIQLTERLMDIKNVNGKSPIWHFYRILPEGPKPVQVSQQDRDSMLARATALVPGSWYFSVTFSKDFGVAEFKPDGTFSLVNPSGYKAAGPWSIEDGKMSITEVNSAGKVEKNSYEIIQITERLMDLKNTDGKSPVWQFYRMPWASGSHTH